MEFQPFQFTDFHGGISDNFIDTALFRYENADNFLVTENKKLYTRPGSTIYNSTEPKIPVSQRISAIIDHNNQDAIFFISAKKMYYLAAGIWTTLQGPTGNDIFTSGDINSIVSWAEWNKHSYVTNSDFSPVMRIYRDSGNVLCGTNAGLPRLATTPTVASSGGVGPESYVYSFHYSQTYTVGTVTFLDSGAITRVPLENVFSPALSSVTISAFPVLVNGVVNNYTLTTLKIKIYRTLSNGTISFYLGEVTNPTIATIFTDNFSDATISTNSGLYSDSGELEHDAPPLCKAIHVTDTLGFYGHIKTSSGEILSNRIMQSIPDDPDSVPATLFVDVDDEVVAISSAGQTPIVLCKKSIYRLDGAFTATGDGLLTAQEIESTVGCISANSVVQIQRGIVFAGEGGFYFTDGWEVRKLSQAWNSRYKEFSSTQEQKNHIYGTFDRMTKRVWFSIQEVDQVDQVDQVDSNKCYVLDTRYGLGVAGDDLEDVNVCFTPVHNGENFAPTATLFVNGDLIRADRRGYVFKHIDGLYSDPLIDTTKPLFADWDIVHIPWKFTSMATSMGTSLKRKFIPKMVITAENDTNISVQITSINDIGKQSYDLTPLRFRKNWVWSDPSILWGDETQIWNFKGIIEEERKFQSEGLRCSYKQIQISNAYVQIVTSDHLGTVTANGILNTVVLEDIVNFSWVPNMREYYIYLSNDNYVKRYRVLSRNSTTLTVEDLTDELPSLSNLKFIVKGYPKNEILNLVSLSFWYSYLGNAFQYNAATAGSTPA